MGGVKISTKIGAMTNLAKIADHMLVGGALANNFLKAQGTDIGTSLYEPKMIPLAQKLLENKKLVVPVDFSTQSTVQSLTELSSESEILDIGLQTIKLFVQYINDARHIIWNGPLGYFENKKFAKGTKAIAQAMLKNKKARIVLGGGETITALVQLTKHSIDQLPNNIFVSSGGGALLMFLAGKPLPGIQPLIK